MEPISGHVSHPCALGLCNWRPCGPCLSSYLLLLLLVCIKKQIGYTWMHWRTSARFLLLAAFLDIHTSSQFLISGALHSNRPPYYLLMASRTSYTGPSRHVLMPSCDSKDGTVSLDRYLRIVFLPFLPLAGSVEPPAPSHVHAQPVRCLLVAGRICQSSSTCRRKRRPLHAGAQALVRSLNR